MDINNLKLEDVTLHILKNKSTVCGISDHGFRFSDGTSCPGQNRDIVDSLKLRRQFKTIKNINGMAVNEVLQILDSEQQVLLQKLESFCDILIVPFPVLTALKQQDIRHLFPKCLAFNATQDTQHLAPSEKIVDVTNWSW